MILCYNPPNISDTDKQKKIDYLLDKYMMFFVDVDDIIISTETNQKLLRLIIKESDIVLFWMDSLKDISLSPTEISELIIYCLKYEIDFHSQSDDLYFTPMDIDTVYPTIFEYYRKKK